MPIYEFYCRDCHVVFNFHSWRVDTDTRPSCPRCERPELERQVSRFAISSGQPETAADDPLGHVGEQQLEQAMMSLAGEAETLDDDDPRQMGSFMRKLFDRTGLEPGDGMLEAIRRMEAGDDPDRIEEDMGDVLERDDPFGGGADGGSRLRRWRRRVRPPERDPTLHSLRKPDPPA